MTKLIIARHGNTFGPEDTPTRVGAKTDLPLVEKGLLQGQALGRALKEKELFPDVVYASNLQRTQQTACEALGAMGVTLPVYTLDIFNEIDYGPDENQTEDKVIARIGEDAIQNWDKHGIVPQGWKASAQEIIENWIGFTKHISKTDDIISNQVLDIQETILVVTSNGIARFAPHITGDFDSFAKEFPLKLSTGAYGILEYDGQRWRVIDWNIRPPL